MTFQPAPQVALLEWIYNTPSGVAENTYHVSKIPDWGAVDLLALATSAYEWWATSMAAFASNTVTLMRVEAKSLEAASAPFAVYSPGALASGSTNEGAAAGNVTFVIKHTTGLTGRANRGRWYLVGLPASQGINSVITIATAAAITGAFTALDAALIQPDGGACLVHRQVNNVVLPEATHTPITGHSYSDVNTDSQRRRLKGRGQ